MIRAYIFDMDGLLVETESTHVRAFEEFMRRKGVSAPEGLARSFVGFSIRHNIERIQAELGLCGDTEALVSERNGLYLEMLAGARLEVLPGVAEALALAGSRGLKRAVCSSSEQAQLDLVLPRLLAAVGESRGPEEYFDVIVSGDDVERLKPFPDIYIECARRLGCEAGECLAFEDSPAGARAATAAGMSLVVVPNEYSRHVTDWPTPHVATSLLDAIASAAPALSAGAQ